MTATVTVLGGSNLGYAYAGDLARRGADVTLWVRSERHHGDLLERQRVHVTGVGGDDDAAVAATTDLDAALAAADVVVVGVPSGGYPELFEALAPRLQPRHTVVLTPGNAGSVRLRQAAGSAVVAETAHPLFGARRTTGTGVDIVARAVELPVGTLPAGAATDTSDLLNATIAPVFVPARSVLDAALNNPNPIFHTVPCTLNIGYLQGVDRFHLYRDGMTEGIVRALDAADRERIALREACGYGAPHYPQWTLLDPQRDPTEPRLFETETFAMAARSPEYHGPHTLEHRFVDEDTANLVWWVELAELAGVAAPVMAGVVALVSAASGRDYRRDGRRLASCGLPDSSLESILEVVG